jgi:hypothetical protein
MYLRRHTTRVGRAHRPRCCRAAPHAGVGACAAQASLRAELGVRGWGAAVAGPSARRVRAHVVAAVRAREVEVVALVLEERRVGRQQRRPAAGRRRRWRQPHAATRACVNQRDVLGGQHAGASRALRCTPEAPAGPAPAMPQQALHSGRRHARAPEVGQVERGLDAVGAGEGRHPQRPHTLPGRLGLLARQCGDALLLPLQRRVLRRLEPDLFQGALPGAGHLRPLAVPLQHYCPLRAHAVLLQSPRLLAGCRSDGCSSLHHTAGVAFGAVLGSGLAQQEHCAAGGGAPCCHEAATGNLAQAHLPQLPGRRRMQRAGSMGAYEEPEDGADGAWHRVARLAESVR